jgi:hypothetical protein
MHPFARTVIYASYENNNNSRIHLLRLLEANDTRISKQPIIIPLSLLRRDHVDFFLRKHVPLCCQDTHQRISDLEFFHDGPKPGQALALIKNYDEQKVNLPIAPDFRQQIFLDILNVLRRQLAEPLVLHDHSPSHNRCDLAVERKSIAQIEQLHEIAHADFRHLVRVLLLRFVCDVVFRRTGRHEGVSANGLVGTVVGAHHQVLHVVHAGALETEDAGRVRKSVDSLGGNKVEECRKQTCGKSTVGVEEKDRAFDRTLKRNLSRADHNPTRYFVAGAA